MLEAARREMSLVLTAVSLSTTDWLESRRARTSPERRPMTFWTLMAAAALSAAQLSAERRRTQARMASILAAVRTWSSPKSLSD